MGNSDLPDLEKIVLPILENILGEFSLYVLDIMYKKYFILLSLFLYTCMILCLYFPYLFYISLLDLKK